MTKPSASEARRPAADFAFCVAVGVFVFGFGYLAVCVAGRVGSVWPLEWMEGASAVHAQRLLRGLPLYAAPRADFIPFVYPPLSYLPMAVGLFASGGALWGARLASLLAVVLCCIALWRAGKHASGTHAAGALAVGLFAMGYGYCGGFIDLARVDAWFCALCLCGVERLCARRHGSGLLLLALACLAKQHAVLLLAAASGGVWLLQGRGGLRAIGASWLALAACVTALCVWSAGWIWTYCVTVPARHGVEPQLLLSFVLVDLCVYLPVLTALCACFVVTRRSWLLSLLLLAAIAASALGRAHPGGDDNVRLPAYALSALLAALGFCDLLANRPRLRWPLTAALALQLALLFQPPTLYWPTQQTADRFAQLKAELTRCAGSHDFAAMDHAGLGDHALVHTLALSDLRMNQDTLADQATHALLTALRAEPNPGSAASAAAREGAAGSSARQSADSPARVGASAGWSADSPARVGASAGWSADSPARVGASAGWSADSPARAGASAGWFADSRARAGAGWSADSPTRVGAGAGWFADSPARVGASAGWFADSPARVGASAGWPADLPARAGASAGWSADSPARVGASGWSADLPAREGGGPSDGAKTGTIGAGARAPRALAISSSFPALMRTLAQRYELCARTPELALPTGYKLSETYIYRHKAE